jgi:glycosyltransferase involved in cell wall biosynthesis
MLEAAGLSGGAWTALRMSSLMDQRHQALIALFSLVDRVVALSPWVRELLKRNEVPDSKIVVSPHGIRSRVAQPVRPAARQSGRVRIAHLGRLDPVKGTGLLIRALRLIPDAPIDLDVFGIVQGSTDVDVRRQLKRLAEGDPRVTFHDAIEHLTVIDRLAGYDLVAVPSQWLETGPLVVLEAFAAGVPVLGSALGGLLDKLNDGVDGLLIRPYDSVEAWSAALRRCVAENGLMARLRLGVRAPRSMDDVADEMVALYRNLIPQTGGRVADMGAVTAAALQ